MRYDFEMIVKKISHNQKVLNLPNLIQPKHLLIIITIT
jgi:hypothetical protein